MAEEFKLLLHDKITLAFSGNKFTGKSHLAKHFVRTEYPVRNIIYEPGNVADFQKSGFQNVHLSKTNTPEEFEAFCGELIKRKIQNVMLVVDEAQNFLPGKGAKLGPNALEIVMFGRHYGIGLMVTTKRPALLNKDVLEEVNYLFLFRHMIPNDIEYLLDIIGPDAWILQHLKDHRFMIYSNSGGESQGGFYGPFMLVGDKIMEDPDERLKRDRPYIQKIGEECYLWLRKHGIKGAITRANVDVYIKENNLELLPGTEDMIYNYANTKSKIKR